MQQFVVLGIGGNLGDRLAQFTHALQLLRQRNILSEIRCSELFESEALLLPGSPADWNIPFYNVAISGQCALTPQELLAAIKQIEQELGRGKRERWAPREIDIDILTYGTDEIRESNLDVPHPGLGDRPFALWPLSALAPDYAVSIKGVSEPVAAACAATRWGFTRNSIPCKTWRADNRAQRQWQTQVQNLNMPLVAGPFAPTELMGVINVTPDSFSDGGKFLSSDHALNQAQALYEAGASILDLGAESTRPSAKALSPEEEWERLDPVLYAIKEHYQHQPLRPLLSVDTRHAEVARKSLEVGIDWLNDVTGFEDPTMLAVAAESQVDIVAMHSLGIPPHKDRVLSTHRSATKQILEWGEKTLSRLERAGIAHERVILDPGIGFGKTAQQSAEILANAAALKTLGARILIGHSRKSFQTLFTERPADERDPETRILSAMLANAGIEYLRVHDVDGNCRSMNLLYRRSN